MSSWCWRRPGKRRWATTKEAPMPQTSSLRKRCPRRRAGHAVGGLLSVVVGVTRPGTGCVSAEVVRVFAMWGMAVAREAGAGEAYARGAGGTGARRGIDEGHVSMICTTYR